MDKSFWIGVAITALFALGPAFIRELLQAIKAIRSDTIADLDEEIQKRLRATETGERLILEERLHALWDLSERHRQTNELRNELRDKSMQFVVDEGDDEEDKNTIDTEDVTWVTKYAYREIRKIGERLRELDLEDIQKKKDKPH